MKFLKIKELVNNSDKIFEVLLLLSMLVISLIWILEENLLVILEYDRYGYLFSLIAILLSLYLSIVRQNTRLAKVFLFVYLVIYLLTLIILGFAHALNSLSIYSIASTLQWMPIVYIVAFLFLSNRQATYSVVGIYLFMLVLLFLPYSGLFTLQNPALKALLLNVALSHAVYIFCMFGVVKLKQTKRDSDIRAEKMEQAANVDGLLAIGNRRFLQMQLEQCVNANKRLALLVIDIDHFKHINDTYGHITGDDVLRQITQCMQQCLRPEDVIGRWGGEEFLVLAMGASATSAVTLAERIRKRVEGHQFMHVGMVTVSIGVAEFQQNMTAIRAFSVADGALYKAKEMGRNRVEVAS
ncbi:MAG: diguanylate cyclase (GGDEF)-like protein [Paraglaciecola sp.]